MSLWLRHRAGRQLQGLIPRLECPTAGEGSSSAGLFGPELFGPGHEGLQRSSSVRSPTVERLGGLGGLIVDPRGGPVSRDLVGLEAKKKHGLLQERSTHMNGS